MTKIVEGRMIITRINIRIPPAKGEAIIREPAESQDGSDGKERLLSISNTGSEKK